MQRGSRVGGCSAEQEVFLTSLVLAVTMCCAMSERSRLQAKPTLMAVSCTSLILSHSCPCSMVCHCRATLYHASVMQDTEFGITSP